MTGLCSRQPEETAALLDGLRLHSQETGAKLALAASLALAAGSAQAWDWPTRDGVFNLVQKLNSVWGADSSTYSAPVAGPRNTNSENVVSTFFFDLLDFALSFQQSIGYKEGKDCSGWVYSGCSAEEERLAKAHDAYKTNREYRVRTYGTEAAYGAKAAAGLALLSPQSICTQRNGGGREANVAEGNGGEGSGGEEGAKAAQRTERRSQAYKKGRSPCSSKMFFFIRTNELPSRT